MDRPRPLLILSDSPSAPTGLARITRELATRIQTKMPEFRVATVGYGGCGSMKLPFQQYHVTVQDWQPLDLPQVWDDFCGAEPGILMTIWDLARVGWLGQCENPELQCQLSKWVLSLRQSKRMKLWGYFPVDARGPHGRLSYPLKQTALGFDRVLLYSNWAKAIFEESGIANTHALPHGIDTEIFYPRNHQNARMQFGFRILNRPWHIKPDEFLVGIVATNQPRKDWQLGIHTASRLRDFYGKKVWLWLHTDAIERHWSLPALLYDYGFIGHSQDTVFVTTHDLSDEQMAWGYSACDVTFGIGKGEGFGFPLAESLACGTPVIHGNYGGAVDWMPPRFLVDPIAFYSEGLYADERPIFDHFEWAKIAHQARREDAKLPVCLEWNTLFGEFAKWLRQGLQ